MNQNLGEGEIHHVNHDLSTFSLIKRTIDDVRLYDPPLLLLYLFHIIWFTLLLRTRKQRLQSSLCFIATCLFIGLTPTFNNYMADHWMGWRFRSNYFDLTCFFIFIFWCFPLLVEAGVFLIVLIADIVKAHWNESIRKLVLEWVEKKLLKMAPRPRGEVAM
jgi:hydrogenase-4 membrane subunit HyfE